jgi:hypothetical protein
MCVIVETKIKFNYKVNIYIYIYIYMVKIINYNNLYLRNCVIKRHNQFSKKKRHNQSPIIKKLLIMIFFGTLFIMIFKSLESIFS